MQNVQFEFSSEEKEESITGVQKEWGGSVKGNRPDHDRAE